MDGNAKNGLEPAKKTPTAHMAVTTVKVDGMTCGACTSAVESGFKNVDGAGAVSVSLVMGRAVVHHDPTKLSAARVAEIIEDRGFDAEVLSTDMPETAPPPAPKRLTSTSIAVEGMTCGACTSSVESAFTGVAGVEKVEVSLLSERAVIEHDASVIAPEKLAEMIEDRGFGATVLDSVAQDAALAVLSAKTPLTTPDRNITVTTVAIEGMTCGACTSSIERKFKGLEGMLHFNISLLAERAVVSHDPARLSPDRIVALIEDAGFDAQILSSQPDTAMRQVTTSSVQLKIYGLFDGAAARQLEDTLRSKEGITNALLNLSTSRATVTYDTSLTGIRGIVEGVEKAGYNALLADTEDNNAQIESLAKTKEIQEWKRAFLYSLSFAVPVFCISMLIPMFLPILNIAKIELIPGLNFSDIICCALTIPVQFGIGKRFYISAWKSIKHRSPTMDVLVMLGTSAAFFFSCFAVVVAVLSPPTPNPARSSTPAQC